MPAQNRQENLLDYFYFLSSWREILVTKNTLKSSPSGEIVNKDAEPGPFHFDVQYGLPSSFTSCRAMVYYLWARGEFYQ